MHSLNLFMFDCMWQMPPYPKVLNYHKFYEPPYPKVMNYHKFYDINKEFNVVYNPY